MHVCYFILRWDGFVNGPWTVYLPKRFCYIEAASFRKTSLNELNMSQTLIPLRFIHTFPADMQVCRSPWRGP